jgi:pinin
MFDPFFLTPFVFGRTKAEPAIYYMPVKPLSDDPAIVEQTKEKVGSSLCKLSSFIH